MRTVNIRVNTSVETGPMDHIWRYIGYDECNYTYVPEGKELLKKFAALPDAPYYIRTHFMFCTGNCLGTFKFGSTNVYTEDETGEPVYDFEYYDLILDTQLETGNKPFVELGFMPEDLYDKSYVQAPASSWQTHDRYKEVGWSCPPKDYKKWHAFITALAEHLKDRYGADEIATWYFEMWNEPDIFYWSGSTAEYCKLYDYTENALHAVLPDARFGGPAVTGILKSSHSEEFLRYFLNHCANGINFCTGKIGSKLDYITFHAKGGGFPFNIHAKKAVPSIESLIYQVKMGLDVVKETGFDDREIVLSEADPDGWAAGGCHDNPNMIFRNTEYYASYVASAFEKIARLGREYNMTVRPLSWAFMFPGERCFEGTRTFTTQGIDKAVFNLFKIYGQLGSTGILLESDGAESMNFLEQPETGTANTTEYTGEGEETDISGFAVKGENGETEIVIYSHNNDRDLEEENEVCLIVEGLPVGKAVIEHYRIDSSHSNAYKKWVEEGKPLFPEGEQYARIKAEDRLGKLEADRTVDLTDGTIQLHFSMPAHGVSFLVIR